MRLHKNQSGSAVIILLIILILAIVGLGGYYVWHTNHKSATKTATAVSSQDNFQDCAKVNGAILVGATLDQLGCTTSAGKHYTSAPLASIKTSNKAVYQVGWAALPPALQQAVTQAWPSECSATDQLPASVLKDGKSMYITADSTAASVPVGCEGAAAHLFVVVQGSWPDVAHTQLAFSCDTITKYQVPVGLLGVTNECFDSSNIEHLVVAK